MSNYKWRLRPHHGMCMAYFQGCGYSEVFTRHMTAVLEELEGESVPLKLTVGCDEVCSHCPNLIDGICRSGDKSDRYDLGVLEVCGLAEGEILSSEVFFSRVRERILSTGKRTEICGDCQWNHLCQGEYRSIGGDNGFQKTENF